MIGEALGPFRIDQRLGAGGMGEVYLATDTRLGRRVAIKVLAAKVSHDPLRRQRFEREARAISRLSHPYICALYDIGRTGEIDYLVMELVEGETLAERLRRGPMPVGEALRSAVEITDALAAAHRRGIVHRDLKPGNVMLTRSGVKLLDFGLAKLRSEEGHRGELQTALPTASEPLSEEGTLLGTYPYMAPEQLEGAPVDARTDLFAFGAVLYEMLTGERAFTGSSRSSLIGAILHTEPPPLAERRPQVPASLERVVRKCLAKDPEERWQSAKDLRDELQWIAEAAREAAPGAAASERRAHPTRLALVAFGLLVVAVIASASVGRWLAPDPPPRQPIATTVELPAGARLTRPARLPSFTIAPDGRNLVYAAASAEGRRLYLQPLDRFEPLALAGTEGADSPFFSPDGRSIGFLAGTRLKWVPVAGGTPFEVTEVRSGYLAGAAWLEDGTIVYSPGFDAGLWRVPATGGTPQLLTSPDREAGERGHWFPRSLPGGKTLLFTIDSGASGYPTGESTLAALSLVDGRRIDVVEGVASASNAQYLATGHLLYRKRGGLVLAPFDPAAPGRVADERPFELGLGDEAAWFEVSATGTLVLGPPRFATRAQRLVWVRRDGVVEPLLPLDGSARSPRVSPDGRSIAYDQGGTVLVLDTGRGTIRALQPEGSDAMPVWSPDGTELIIQSAGERRVELVRVSLATEERKILLARPGGEYWTPTSWSPDGRFLLSFVGHPSDIWALPLDGDAEPFPFFTTPYMAAGAAFSPDGRWVAFVSNRSGADEVYLTSFPDRRFLLQVSSGGGVGPRWAPDGSEIYYQSYQSGEAMYAVTIAGEDDPVLEAPRRLFSGRFVSRFRAIADFDVAPDGRLLMIEDAEGPPDRLRVIVDWVAGLSNTPSATDRGTRRRAARAGRSG